MTTSAVGVIGTGVMGLGITQACAAAGVPVVAVKATPGSIDSVRDRLSKSLARAVERGKVSGDDRDRMMSLVTFTSDEADVADCDLISENIVEHLEPKIALFQRLEEIVSQACLLTTNTSALSVTEIMAACRVRHRVAGLHFFNPAPVMKLVEIVHGFETSDDALDRLNAFCTGIGKEPVLVQDTTGFIVNRLLTPYLLNAIRLLEQGTGTIGAIDKAMTLGTGAPMGPFALADYIGLDVVHAMSRNIYDDVRQQYTSSPHTLTRLVQLGYLGRKSGRGFYDYRQSPAVPNPALRRPVG